MKKLPITVVLLAMVLCVSTALAFELGFNFSFSGRNGIKWINLLPFLSGWTPPNKTFENTTTGRVKRQSFTVSNTGNTYAEDVAVSVTGSGFTLYSTPTLGNISSGRTLTAKVRFTPAVQGIYSGHLTYSAPNIAAVSAALVGVGVSGSLDPYTTYFANSFTCTDGDYSTILAGCTTANAFTSMNGTTENSISGNKYIVTKSGTSAAAQLYTATMTAYAETQLKFVVTLASVTNVAVSGATTTLASLRNGSNAAWDILLVPSGTNYSTWRVVYRTTGGSTVNVTGSTYSFTAGHTYSVRLTSKNDTGGAGNFTLYISDNGAAETTEVTATNIATQYANISRVYIGVAGSGNLTNTWSFDNLILGHL